MGIISELFFLFLDYEELIAASDFLKGASPEANELTALARSL
jgi:hypothetical protein